MSRGRKIVWFTYYFVDIFINTSQLGLGLVELLYLYLYLYLVNTKYISHSSITCSVKRGYTGVFVFSSTELLQRVYLFREMYGYISRTSI